MNSSFKISSSSTSSSSSSIHHHHHHHLFWKRQFIPCSAGLDVCPESEMKPLHISQNTAHSVCKLSSFMSSFTHPLQVFLPLLTHLFSATSTFLQADTQSSPLLCSRCLNYLNLPPSLTTSATLWIPKRLCKTSLRFLSFEDTPHIHLTISLFSSSYADSQPSYQDITQANLRKCRLSKELSTFQFK